MIEDFIRLDAVAPAARPTASGRAAEPPGSFAEAVGFLLLAVLVWLAMHALKLLGQSI